MDGTRGVKTRIVRAVALVEHREQHPPFWTISVADVPSRNVINQTIHRGLSVDVYDCQALPSIPAGVDGELSVRRADDNLAASEVSSDVVMGGLVVEVPVEGSVGVVNFSARSIRRPVTVPGHQHLAGWENLDFMPAGSAILHANHKTLRDDSIRAEVIEDAHREPAARRRPDQPVFAPVIG